MQKPPRPAHSLATEDYSVWHHFSRYVTPVQRKPYYVRNGYFQASAFDGSSEGFFKEGKKRPIENALLKEKKEKPNIAFSQGQANQDQANQGQVKKKGRRWDDIKNLEEQASGGTPQRSEISAQTRLRPLQAHVFRHEHDFAAWEWRVSELTEFKGRGKGVRAQKKGEKKKGEKKKGEKTIRPLRKLDLHGLTVHKAFVIFYDFVINAYRDDIGCIEVITGMGNSTAGNTTGSTTGGLIKRELPLWLERPDIADFIHAVCYSSPRNYGALKILLRKKKGRNSYF
ncbi:Smr/MutS family protein [Entomobacter blattae]|nr:Smr/MutS family protein [Entomobacter blattae]